MCEKSKDYKPKDVVVKEDGTWEAIIETPDGLDVKVPPKK